ncbi:MAG: hypothetical protein U9O56_00290 [Campylobacterota bacterium]|nr:hypothetical protein [Campylobacterota bacterium]
MKLLVGLLFIFVNILNANTNTSLFYKINKGAKDLGYYEINYNKNNNIFTKSYGVADKVNFFVDKKIKYLDAGTRDIKFSKNNIDVRFIVRTKMDLLSDDIKEKFNRKLKKVKNNDMLLVTKTGKNSIELFNKRKITLLSLEEVLKQIIDNKVVENIILFEKSGVMKMVASVKKTKDGYDIINKTKGTKYIKIVMKNNLPILVKSYVSNWSMVLEGAGKFKLNKVEDKKVQALIIKKIEKQLSKSDAISFESIKKITSKKSSFFITYNAEVKYNTSLSSSDGKRFCNRTIKKVTKKGYNTQYNKNSCISELKIKIKSKDIVEPILKGLYKNHKQLKFTKKYKISKNGTVMYKIIDTIK